MSRFIEIVEVGPRDGLQNEKALLDVDQKLAFIGRLEAAGARRMETVVLRQSQARAADGRRRGGDGRPAHHGRPLAHSGLC
jgi:isopropylmalate/homocitrate/citramalate synthase